MVAILVVEARQRDPMHQLGTMVVAVRAGPLERGRGIGDYDHGEAEVGRHAHGRRYAMIGGDADDDDGVDLMSPEVRFECRPDEGAVHGLLEDGFARLGGGFRLERVAGPVWPER